jgi:hypothetical protein
MACGDGGLATAEWREPASYDRLPIHRSEPPTGYSSAGCSPAEPASASPVTDNSTSNPDPARQSNALLNLAAGMQSRPRLHACVSRHTGQFRMPFALAPHLVVMPCRGSSCPPPAGVSSLLCAPSDISSVTGPCWSIPLSHDPAAGVFLLSGVGARPPPDGVG